jgi:hypothetical protein
MLCALQIHAEVSDFWGVMEAVAASRHAHLLATLNTHLAALTQQVGGSWMVKYPGNAEDNI